MKLSWDIQLSRNANRSKALMAAWAIIGNEDITAHYLTRKLNHFKPVHQQAVDPFALFTVN
jgi:hypothetical protein